jgi:hypothetical protein
MFMEKVVVGDRVTLVTPPVVELPELLPRQPVRAEAKMMANVSRSPERQRSMNPPRARSRGASKM